MIKKPQKSREEKTVENYFPVDESNLKRVTEKQIKEEVQIEDLPKKTTEKLVKEFNPERELLKRAIEKMYSELPKKDIEIFEKINEKNGKRKKIKIKEKITTTKIKKENISKSLLKEKNYELIITEKPQAALKISSALGEYSKRDLKGVPYYEVNRNGKKIVVACAVGHLFTLKQITPKVEIPVFEIKWVPNHQVKRGDFSKKYYDVLESLSKNAGEITVATDFDVEGEVIGINVVRMICNKNDANRIKFSTLTDKEINFAYEHKSNTIHWGQAVAGETRHYLDWYYGINLSRALMNAIKTTGKFKIMSIGRVQGPTLNLIVQKEIEIQDFKPTPYWQVFLTLKDLNLKLKYIRDIIDKNELKKFENLVGKEIYLKTTKSEQIMPPNPPMNLTTLQTESYRLYGLTPSNTLKIAQSLYLAGLISYPRTSSQKLPNSIDYKSILELLKQKYKASKLIKRDTPIEGSKTDPAHPSIYPTGNSQILSGDEEKIYDLIVKRFLALFCEDAIIEKKKISGIVEDLEFSTSGASVKKKAWLEIYPLKIVETEIPDVNEKKEIKNVEIEEKETQPPKRYSQASIISELEKRNLGTKATRATILETLYDRDYIKEKSIEATPLGISLIKTLEKYSPIIIDEQLTRELQDETDEIIEKEENHLEEKEEKILEKAKKIIREIIKQFENKEEVIGKELIEAQEEQRAIERKENTLCLCPKCEKGNLIINYSRKNKKYFVACDSYPECKNTYSLPPGGALKKTDKVCEKCNFPLLMSLRREKRPWIFCFNPLCESNRERMQAYKDKKNEENQ